jgi:hypothetical protein
VQSEKAFYFSYDIDLTKNIQMTIEDTLKMSRMGKPFATSSEEEIAYENALVMREAYPNCVDYIPQYAFNDRLLGEYKGIEYSPFKIPCIFGFVFISSPRIKNGVKTDFYLISRKDCRRPGRRFITRGLDSEGNAANFVETEHIFV